MLCNFVIALFQKLMWRRASNTFDYLAPSCHGKQAVVVCSLLVNHINHHIRLDLSNIMQQTKNKDIEDNMEPEANMTLTNLQLQNIQEYTLRTNNNTPDMPQRQNN